MSTTTGISRDVLNDQLARANADAERIVASFKVDEKGRFTISADQNRDYVAAIQHAKEVKSIIDGTDLIDANRRYLEDPAGTSVAATDAGSRGNAAEFKSLADVFMDSPQFREAAAKDFRDVARIRGEMSGKSIFSLSGGTVEHQAFGQVDNRGLYEQKVRQWHVRDLFPKSSTKASVITGVRETGFVNNAAQVPETTGPTTYAWVKAPISNLTFTPMLVPVVEIAHTLQAHKNILADEPRLKTFINQRMMEGVKFKEDYDLLNSTGGADKLTGLFNQPGVQEYTGLSSDKFSIQLRRAITKAQLAEYEPTGVVISPTRWEELEIETDNTGAFRVATQVAIGADRRLWRTPVIATTAMSDDNYLLGAFGQGAMLHDRENVSVSVSTENATNFEEGVVSVRADERVALEVMRPESFVIGAWTA